MTASTFPSTRSRRSPPTAGARPRPCPRWAGRTGSAPGPRRAPRRARSPRSSSSSIASDWPSRAMPSGPIRRGNKRWSRRSVLSRPKISSRRSPTSRRRWNNPGQWTGSFAVTSASARPKSRFARSSRQSKTANRRPSWPQPPCWPASTPRPSQTATRPTRCVSNCSAGSCPRPNSARSSRDWPTAASTW